jgi:hypothetical protein
LFGDVISILKDNITKVQENKDYIPQAQAINNSINTLVNITKLRIGLLKPVKSITSSHGGKSIKKYKRLSGIPEKEKDVIPVIG